MDNERDEERPSRLAAVVTALGPTLSAILVAVLTAFIVTPITAGITLWVNERARDRHDVSISVIRSDNGVEEGVSGPLLGENPFDPPTVTPGRPATEFTYTALIRNNGDFSETDIVIEIAFRSDASSPIALIAPELIASTNLLESTISEAETTQPQPSYALRLERLTVGEWVAFRIVWNQEMEGTVEFRSESIAEQEGF